MEKNMNMVRHNKCHKREVFFEDVIVRCNFMELYKDLFPGVWGQAHTNRMYVGFDISDYYTGKVYYGLELTCDNETWDYINRFNEFKVTKIEHRILDNWHRERRIKVYQV